MTTLLQDLIAKLEGMPQKDRDALDAAVTEASKDLLWVPNIGPQADAYDSLADELLYGGTAGCGKSGLLLGLALTRHERSLILRKQFKDTTALIDDAVGIVGHNDGLNRQSGLWRLPSRSIEFAHVGHDNDKQSFKGRPHDLKAWDELTDFTEAIYTFVNGWNRTTTPGQRCRIVGATNPPTTVEGLWVVKRWAAWLDPGHANPAKPGELRWYTTIGGTEVEVDGPDPIPDPTDPLHPLVPKSRTFIPGRLEDNPDLERSGYRQTLQAMPEPYRSAYLEGRFDVSLKDDDRQLIPTRWVIEAQERWTPEQPKGIPMTAIGCDPNGGGRDACILAPRYGAYFLPLIEVKDVRIDDAKAIGAEVFKVARDRAPIVMDFGGGYGGAPAALLRSNGFEVKGFNGANGSTAKTRDGAALKFVNRRAEAWWRFREALDPSQPGGSHICLPPDGDLRADLCSPRFEITSRGILIESKDDIRDRLARSPDKGDAVVMSYSEGEKLSAAAVIQRNAAVNMQGAPVQRGYSQIKRRHN